MVVTTDGRASDVAAGPAPQAGDGRVVLLLQGPFSFFFTHLARSLGARGAKVWRILLCPGDQLFWRGEGGVAFRGRPEEWPAYVAAFMKNRGVTDIACLGDGRRWHADAIAAARAEGVRVHLVEQGYLRPHFLTLEPDGTGGRTRFPTDWPAIEALAAGAAPPGQPRFATSFFGYAAMDVGFNLANILGSWALYPQYRAHAIDHPVTEWTGWIWNKILPLRRRRRRQREAEARIAAHRGPVFIHPLQLETDYQIRLHAPKGGVRGLLRSVIASFAEAAPGDALLLVKIHPLDHGWANWRRRTVRAARDAGIADRVVYLDGGDLDGMIARSAGVIVANSTVGLTALRLGAPVVALGKAIYDLPGLTFQGGLDRFWSEAAAPDEARLATFLAALGRIQLPGGFDGEGARPGAEAMAEKLLAPPPYRSEEGA